MNYRLLKKTNIEKIKKYELNKNDGMVDFYPRYIQLEQTNRCNARCIMCNHFYISNNGASDISSEVIERMVDVFPFCETIMLNGDGEPFLSANIIENIKLMSDYKVEIGTNTNLNYVPNGLWEYIQKDFKFLNISCDGATASIYEMIRRGLSFDKFIYNLKKLECIAPGLKKNIDCVIMKQNIKELPRIVELASHYGITCVKFHRLGINPCIGNELDDPEYYFNILKESLYEAEELGRKLGISVSSPHFVDRTKENGALEPFGLAEEIEKRFEQSCLKYGNLTLESDYYSELVMGDKIRKGQWLAGKLCQWALERCYIDLKGNVTTCCFNMKKYMGNLLVNSFDEIWNGEAYKELRRMMAENFLPEFCHQCNWIKESRF